MAFFKENDSQNMKAIEEELNRKCLEKLFASKEKGDYQYEEREKHYDAIRTGNREQVQKLFRETKLNPDIKQKYESIRKLKNYYIIELSIATRAAMEGGVVKEMIYILNETYVELLEACHTEKQIEFVYQYCINDLVKKVDQHQKRKYSQTIHKCLHYIERHIHETIRIEELAKVTGLSNRQLMRKFKSELSCSIIEFIQKEKMKEAKRMLEFSEYSILEIGYLLDFCSQSYFISAFKKYEGMTPAYYREFRRRTQEIVKV